MYLKRLHMQGFKSFALRTDLEFVPGITAIVGPNGSGKSNVADGLRWILGEQNMRQLRGKKSEDILFAGGHNRAASGMAEVTLVLDNASGWLPSEFAEVAITRRSFRTGDSDYLINNTKTRLRDVLALLSQARIGHDSYTIIGQGLIDQALSARAEERRSLFEDAAGIRHFQTQRNESEQRLTQTQSNLSRLHDILNEIEPRLGPLAEQARRAHEYIETHAELDRTMRRWFRWQWIIANDAAAHMSQIEVANQARLEGLQTSLEQYIAAVAQLRQIAEEHNQRLADTRRRRNGFLNKIQEFERDLAVIQERTSGTQQSRDEMHKESEQALARQQTLRAEVSDLDDQMAAIDNRADTIQQTVADLEHALHKAQQQHEREIAHVRNLQRDVTAAQSRLTSLQGESTRTNKQIATLQQSIQQRQQQLEQVSQRARDAQMRYETIRIAHEQLRIDLGGLLIEREQSVQTLIQHQDAFDAARSQLTESRSARKMLIDRLNLLQEWSQTQGVTSSALQVLDALPAIERPAILGVLVNLVTIPLGRAMAAEAVLEPFLQGLVTATAQDAQRCAEILTAAQIGRIPILWPTDNHSDAMDSLGQQNQHIAGILAGILNNTEFVGDDIDLWNDQSSEKMLVTPSGVIFHPSGWMMMPGKHSQDDSIFLRMQELQRLPEQIDALDLMIAQHEDALASARAAVDSIRTAQATRDKAIKQLEAKLAESNRTLSQAQREAEKLANEVQVARAVEQQASGELLTIAEELARCNIQIATAEKLLQEQSELHETGLEEMEAFTQETQKIDKALAVARSAAQQAQHERLLAGQKQESLQRQLDEMTSQITKREARTQEQMRRLEELAEMTQKLSQDIATNRKEAQSLFTGIQSLESEIAEIDRQIAAQEKAQQHDRTALAQAENEYRKTTIDAQRAMDAVEQVRRQIVDDMSEEDMRSLCDREIVDEERLSLPEIDELNQQRKHLEQLRNRMKQIGGYDPEAPKAYDELKTRYEFLTAQIRDMEEASARLRAVIIELDATMKRKFEETFHFVNEKFQSYFMTLFKGGAARLELTSSKRSAKDSEEEQINDNPALDLPKKSIGGGIEVFVQIPGKKVQDLQLLSGGERAMVSAALLFALLDTNPPPFCLLDEVDAALDESNVERFCEILELLAANTQFIVITHNRVTMTHASTIYGVTMTESISRILSMRLAEVQSA